MKQLYKTAKQYIPSGVNSPVRAFKAVGGNPVFIKKGKGAYMWDEAGKKYLDFCCSWGPLLFGHVPDGLVKVLKTEIGKGMSFGTATRKEVELARKIRSFFPSMQKVRLVSSGTEAVMSAIRVARGYTGRDLIVKLDGGYHGHVDSLLVKTGSGGATFGIPDSAGVPSELSKLTISIPFNDQKALKQVFKKNGKKIAAFILEPIPANMGVVLPENGYLKKARAITKKYGALLIFDEVMSGFRITSGGAQKHFGVTPDLTCLGKIVGGGLPLAVFGGKSQVMNVLAPKGPVYQAGTLSGNPVAVTAANWMLDQITEKKIQSLNAKSRKFFKSIANEIEKNKLPLKVNSIASMATIFFTKDAVYDYASAKKSNTRKYGEFFRECLKMGIYLAPSQFEAVFVSCAHSDRDLVWAAKRITAAFKNVL